MYLPGTKVIYKGKECTIRFYYPKYKKERDAYIITLQNYREFHSLDLLVYEEELQPVRYEQISLFNRL